MMGVQEFWLVVFVALYLDAADADDAYIEEDSCKAAFKKLYKAAIRKAGKIY